MSRRVVTVLPPKESFGPGRSGAIGMIVHRYAAGDPGAVVIGAPQRGPLFLDATFAPAHRVWPALTGANRAYAAGVAQALDGRRPELIEVYNRPEIALKLAASFPVVPVALFLQNDPQHMRRATTPHARRKLLDWLTGVVVASLWLRTRFLDGAGSGRVFVLPNCLDLARVPPGLAPEDRERVILFAGRVVADKGADVFVAACAQVLPALPGWRAEMIGADRFGPDSPDTPFLRALRPQAQAAGVTMAGYQPHDVVLQAMALAAIVVAPSRWPEPFGLAALEAMACGAALITTRRGGLPEVAGDAALYADPDDPAALAAAIRSLAQSADQRAALSSAGRERAQSFGLPETLERLHAIRAELARWPR